MTLDKHPTHTLVVKRRSVVSQVDRATLARSGGWRRGGFRPAGLRSPPECRPQLFECSPRTAGPQPRDVLRLALQELRSGEWVTESSRPEVAAPTGPARLTRDLLGQLRHCRSGRRVDNHAAAPS